METLEGSVGTDGRGELLRARALESLHMLRGCLGVAAGVGLIALFGLLMAPFLLLRQTWLARPLVGLWARAMLAALGIRVRLHGPLPSRRQNLLVTASHTSVLDMLVYPALLGGDTVFVGKIELRDVPLFGWTFGRLGNIFVNRSGGRNESKKMVDESLRRAKGRCLFIHPEGTRSRTGDLLPFKKGFVFLAIETQKDVLPVVSVGGHELWPKGRLYPTPGIFHVLAGEPVSTQDWMVAQYSQHADSVRRLMERDLQCLRRKVAEKSAESPAIP